LPRRFPTGGDHRHQPALRGYEGTVLRPRDAGPLPVACCGLHGGSLASEIAPVFPWYPGAVPHQAGRHAEVGAHRSRASGNPSTSMITVFRSVSPSQQPDRSAGRGPGCVTLSARRSIDLSPCFLLGRLLEHHQRRATRGNRVGQLSSQAVFLYHPAKAVPPQSCADAAAAHVSRFFRSPPQIKATFGETMIHVRSYTPRRCSHFRPVHYSKAG
jgi:hypothetical protein